MTGPAATSATGAKLTLTPAARRSRPARRASAPAAAAVASRGWPTRGAAHGGGARRDPERPAAIGRIPHPHRRTMIAMARELWVAHLGTVEYREAYALQERLRERRQAGEIPDALLLLEHPPVYTRGRRTGDADLQLGADFYRSRGIEVLDTDRGGRVTYHAPGQLVGYPIMAIDDIGRHLRAIEEAIVTALAEEGVQAHARAQDGPDYTGVWVDDRKIAS